MTRKRLSKTLTMVLLAVCSYALLAIVFRFGVADAVVFGLCTDFSAIAGFPGSCPASSKALYEPMKDLIPIVIGLAGAFVADTLQRRGQFIVALRDLWYEMVKAKGKMMGYVRANGAHPEAYVEAWTAQSNVIDMVRGVYRNVGETRHVVGFRPFEPLLSMLECFEKVDPARSGGAKANAAAIGAEIEESWNALREVFLEEFRLLEPEQSILVPHARRLKQPGAASHAEAEKRRQADRQGRAAK